MTSMVVEGLSSTMERRFEEEEDFVEDLRVTLAGAELTGELSSSSSFSSPMVTSPLTPRASCSLSVRVSLIRGIARSSAAAVVESLSTVSFSVSAPCSPDEMDAAVVEGKGTAVGVGAGAASAKNSSTE